MTSVRFSVIITCYNQVEVVLDAILSVLPQAFASFEVIIVDDGSVDGSQEILKRFEKDAHVVLCQENRGAIAARNLGASLAVGDYLVFLDGDDALMPWALDTYDRIVTVHNPMLILGRHRWVYGAIPLNERLEAPTRIDVVNYDAPMSKDRPCGLSASTFVVARRAFQDVGGWTPDIFQLDLQDLVTKLGYSGRLTLICEPQTAFYRIHAANSIHAVPPFIQSLERIMAKERSGEYPGGRKRRFERRAWLGGLIAFWIKRALAAGLYRKALGLALTGSPMIVAGIVRRAAAYMAGLRPVETIELDAR